MSPAHAPELNPSRKQPMQQVSAAAAMYFADLMGARLQKPAEWKAAYKSLEKADRPNLRDRTWRLQYDWIARSRLGPQASPDAGMFVPGGEKPSAEVWTESKATGAPPVGADKEYDDGTLWFREVAGANVQSLSNLVGNVAEYAVDDAGKLYVIGGSALSPPTRRRRSGIRGPRLAQRRQRFLRRWLPPGFLRADPVVGPAQGSRGETTIPHGRCAHDPRGSSLGASDICPRLTS